MNVGTLSKNIDNPKTCIIKLFHSCNELITIVSYHLHPSLILVSTVRSLPSDTSLTNGQNKLECLSMAGLYSIVLYLQVRPESARVKYPSGVQQG